MSLVGLEIAAIGLAVMIPSFICWCIGLNLSARQDNIVRAILFVGAIMCFGGGVYQLCIVCWR